ncbi:FGGY family carbohydrate kinase [Streptomyces sp. NPDC047108]|uniref:xylulokinase n=1 Tax=Streptomyces sp. NPDC047108 TaxID=3155025 RepID=UPI0033CD5602
MGHVIGVDVGSQSIKGVLVDESGATTAVASAPLRMHHQESGWAEQVPADWTTALCRVVRRLLDAHPVPVDMLALASQVDGVVPVGADGLPLRQAIIWLDRRATAQSDALAEAVGEQALFERTGLNADASHSAPKMMWLRDHDPDVWRLTRRLLPVGGYLLAWLTGTFLQDPANASSTLLYDLRTGDYDPRLCEAAGIDPGLLPAVAPATQVAGQLTRTAAEALGLPRECRVVVGTGDEHAASLAAGVIAPGVVADVTGTAEPVTAAARELVLDEDRLVETHGHAVPGTYLVENPGFVSGGSTLWLATSVLDVAQADIFDLADEAPPGSDGVLFLPALTGATAPRWNADMRGCFNGLSMNHGRPHLARAVLEGCAYALRDIVDRLDALGLAGDEVRIVGGGGRSPLWCRIKADVLGRPVRPVLSQEGTALGAAMLAGTASGIFRDIDDAAARTVRLAPEPVLPGRAATDVYAESYVRYRALFDGVEGALL